MHITRALPALTAGAKLGVALVAAALLALAGSAQEPLMEVAPPIRVVGPVSQPYAYINSVGEAAGFNVDVIHEVGKRLGRQTVVTLTPNMEAALDAIATGEADVLSGVTSSPERAQILAFSRPFTATNVVLFALRERADEFADGNFSDQRIGAREEDAQAAAVVSKTIGVEPVTYETLEEIMLAINQGEIDLIAAPQRTWIHLVRTLQIEDHYVQLGTPLIENNMSIGVSLDQPNLLADVDGALLDLMSEARFEEIKTKWFGAQPFLTVERLGIAASALIAVTLLVSIGVILRTRGSLRAIERRESLQLAKISTLYAKELERKNELLKNNADEMERILFAVTHDLKSPIVTVRGFAGVMDEAVRERDLLAIDLAKENILGGTERLDLITDALLTFGSFGRADTDAKDLDLGSIVNEVRVMLHSQLVKTDASLIVPQLLSALYGDYAQVLRLLLNLVANALRYGCPNPDMTIEVSTERGDGATILSVRDHGPGVPEAIRHDVFRLFRRFGPEHPDSTGLGLAIVEKIASKHGGDCWIEDAPGGGANFRIRFPDKPATVDEAIYFSGAA